MNVAVGRIHLNIYMADHSRQSSRQLPTSVDQRLETDLRRERLLDQVQADRSRWALDRLSDGDWRR